MVTPMSNFMKIQQMFYLLILGHRRTLSPYRVFFYCEKHSK